MSPLIANPNFTTAAKDGTLTRQADGTYLAIWSHVDGSGAAIKGQVFNADGTVKDDPFDIASGTEACTDVSAYPAPQWRNHRHLGRGRHS